MAKDISVEVGFSAGSSTSVSVPEDKLEDLTKALTSDASGWYTVESNDGSRFLIDTSKVVFVRVAATSRSIGFSHA